MNSSADSRLKYGLLALLLFGTEVLIALYLHDRIIRPYIGDLLVVILIYCCVKAVINAPVFATAMGVLLFAYAVEILQYFRVVDLLGLGHSKLARVIIGSSFEWMDMLAYTLGIGLVLILERLAERSK
ncbi:DUF2809 domain-containing protein [Haliscomenobacter sp.]|uniref:ribosomal maturation YjgA family protein n=1 Tax=Haliscomenobacter sp. TaxID=2717303 RepID=UPI003364CB38